MMACPTCGERYVYGTLFCLECGAYLLEAQGITSPPPQVVNTPVKRQAIPDWLQVIPGIPPAEPEPVKAKPAGRVQRVRVFIASSRRMVTLPVTGEVHIGRTDPQRKIYPELDLTEDGGLDAGVSRMHAALQVQDGEVVIVDLGSSNGTWVNGVELLPNRPQPLHDGDEIALGALQLRIYLDTA